MEDYKSCLLALNRIAGFGPHLFAKTIAQWPNIAEIFTFSSQKLEALGMRSNIAAAIVKFDFALIEQDLVWENQDSAHNIIVYGDKIYPKLLLQIPDPSLVLYGCGNIKCLDELNIAVVGSRKPSITGLENAYKFSYELAKCGINIVSGLAIGVDAEAHKAALAAGRSTIAVMGTGIDVIYPQRHSHLAKKIPENGLLLSEFPLKSFPNAGHFPRRNRIISGLALATLVVEAAQRSGSLITARLALEQNREVLAIPGSIYNQQAKGCHYLLKQGARLVTSYVDVLEELNIDISEVSSKDSMQKFLSTEESCYNSSVGLERYIGFEVTTVDKIIARSGMSLDEVICCLARLELNGIVCAVPGGYMRCR